MITARAAFTPAAAVAAARGYVERVRALGITGEQALDLVRAALDD